MNRKKREFPFRYSPDLSGPIQEMIDDDVAAVSQTRWLEKLVREEYQRHLQRKREREGKVDLPKVWTPTLALRFAQFCPACFVIKRNMDIEYANPAYSLALAGGRQLTEMKGRRLSDFVAREDADAIETNIRLALKSERPTESIEAINSDVSDEVGRIKRIYRALRFSFATTTEHRLLGDFTFDWSQIVDGELRKCQTDLHDRIEGEYFATQATAKQFVFDALEQAPLAIAIKRADSKICIACNDTYVELANVHRQKRGKLTREQICGNGDTSGMTMQEIFGLEGDHPSVVKEHQLVIERKWVYDTTSLKPTARKRTSLRFPMFGPQGNVELIGVISANFKLEAYRAGMSWEIQAQ